MSDTVALSTTPKPRLQIEGAHRRKRRESIIAVVMIAEMVCPRLTYHRLLNASGHIVDLVMKAGSNLVAGRFAGELKRDLRVDDTHSKKIIEVDLPSLSVTLSR